MNAPTTMQNVTIGGGWADFRRRVILAAASDEQISDMRASFYAGAFAVMDTFTTLANIDNDVLSVLVMSLLQREKQAFVNEQERAAKQERPFNGGERDDGL